MEAIDYRERIRVLAHALSERGIDAYVGTRQATLHYLVGAFLPWPGAVVVSSDAKAELVYWAMDSERVRQEGWGIPVIDWGAKEPPFAEQLSGRIRTMGFEKARIGLDLHISGTGQNAPGLLLASTYLQLRELLPQAELVNATHVIDGLMLIKGPAELERLRLAAAAADAGFAGGLAAVKVGATENAVAGEIEVAMRRHGSVWAWSSTAGTEVGSGPRTAFHRGVTQQASEKRIGANEFVILDLHPMVELYLSDLGLPVFIGNPTPEQRQMIDCWEETVDLLLSLLKPGTVAKEICGRAVKVFEKHGLADYGLPMFGHGLGTCARLGPFMNTKSEDVLAPGMVLALGTHLYRPGFGGLRLEYPVAITESGAEPLCRTRARVTRVPL